MSQIDAMNRRYDRQHDRHQLLDFLRSSFASLHERLDHIDRRLDELAQRIGRVEQEIAGLHVDFAGLSVRLDRHDERLNRIERDSIWARPTDPVE